MTTTNIATITGAYLLSDTGANMWDPVPADVSAAHTTLERAAWDDAVLGPLPLLAEACQAAADLIADAVRAEHDAWCARCVAQLEAVCPDVTWTDDPDWHNTLVRGNNVPDVTNHPDLAELVTDVFSGTP